jgi:hypothetical protein
MIMACGAARVTGFGFAEFLAVVGSNSSLHVYMVHAAYSTEDVVQPLHHLVGTFASLGVIGALLWHRPT